MSMAAPDLSEVQVVITHELAAQGERYVCGRCPVALAINEHLKPGARAFVGTDTFGFWTLDDGLDLELPDAAKDFIHRYDNMQAITFPVVFPLQIPRKFLKDAT